MKVGSLEPRDLIRALMREHKVFRGEVKMFDASAVIAALICCTSCILYSYLNANAEDSPQLRGLARVFAVIAAVNLVWMIRSILSLWEKLAVLKVISQSASEYGDNRLLRYDRGIGTWRVRTIFDVLFFGGAVVYTVVTLLTLFSGISR